MIDFSSVDQTVGYLNGFGLLTPVVAVSLFTAQTVLPIFPFLVLAGAAGIVFGFWKGVLVAWIGSMLGTCFTFWLVRLTGWDWLHKKIYNKYDINISDVNPWVGFLTVFFGRMFPVVPAQIINIAAGMSGLNFWVFALASGTGKLPVVMFYTGLGNHLIKTRDITGTAVALIVVTLGSYLAAKLIRRVSANEQ